MQEAGRILLMPKGDYAASTSYEMLDLVNHNGASWVCKKDCAGQTPSDSNTEYWQRFGTAVDLSGYVSKTGESNINGKLRINGNSVLDSVNFKEVALPLTGGGTVTDHLYLKISGENDFRVYSVNGNNVSVQFHGKDGSRLGSLGMRGTKPTFVSNSDVASDILHTGNKPTGTYTGNGDATARTITTGGIGKVLYVSRSAYSGIVFGAGGILLKNDGTITGLTYGQAHFDNGKLVVATDGVLNESGIEITYNVV